MKILFAGIIIIAFMTCLGCSSSSPPAVVEPQAEVAPQNSSNKVSDKKGVARLPKK